MANTERRRIDSQGRMLIPMNVEGGDYEDKFMNSTKILTLVGMLIFALVVIAYIGPTSNLKFTLAGKIIIIGGTVLIEQWLLRYVIFEERYYYKMYKKMKLYENPTTDVFWNIASIKDTSHGGVLMYSNMNVGCIVKLERDSIIGKDDSFEEQHFDAISDFYRELMLRNLEFVQINMMGQADTDPRIPKLDDIVTRTENASMRDLLEKELGYIKNMTRATLYEEDYFLIYSTTLDRIDSIISDVEECVYTILDGGYVGYEILSSKDVIELHKEIFGISYFDYNEATINTFRGANIDSRPSINLKALILSNGRRVELNDQDILILKRLASYVQNGDIPESNISILDALEGDRFRNYYNRNNWGVDLDKLAQKNTGNRNNQARPNQSAMKQSYKVRKQEEERPKPFVGKSNVGEMMYSDQWHTQQVQNTPQQQGNRPMQGNQQASVNLNKNSQDVQGQGFTKGRGSMNNQQNQRQQLVQNNQTRNIDNMWDTIPEDDTDDDDDVIDF